MCLEILVKNELCPIMNRAWKICSWVPVWSQRPHWYRGSNPAQGVNVNPIVLSSVLVLMYRRVVSLYHIEEILQLIKISQFLGLFNDVLSAMAAETNCWPADRDRPEATLNQIHEIIC